MGEQRPQELCIHCDDPTGHAGQGDGSLYLGTVGPFCEECFDETGCSGIDDPTAYVARVERLVEVAIGARKSLILADCPNTARELGTALAALTTISKHD